MFRQHLLGLAIEEGTDRVPHDGRYYVLDGDHVQKSFKSLRKALALYAEMKISKANDRV